MFTTPSTEFFTMSNKHHVFEQLGRNANGGPLRPPFDEPTTARDIAIAIRAALVEAGLTPHAIRKVACTLLSVSRSSPGGEQ
jgi:hypothetical protein